MGSSVPRRRWFDCLPLILVALLLGLLTAQVLVVNERAVARGAIEASGGRFTYCVFWVKEFRKGDYGEHVPWYRKLLGDEKAEQIAFPRTPTSEDLRYADYFPEADVLVMPVN